jgi:ubiquitin-protein ligase
LTVTLNIQDTSGHNYSCHLDNQTTIKDIVHDFFESMEWPLQDSLGRGQKAVAEFLDPNTGQYTRLRSDQTLEEAQIPDGSVLKFYPEAIAGIVDARSRREALKADQRDVETLKDSYPHISATANKEEFASEYEVTFKVKSFVAPPRTPGGRPEIGENHEVFIKLPAEYPREAPQLSWLTPIFHPNISLAGHVCLGPLKVKYLPSLGLKRVILLLNEMLHWRNYDYTESYNHEAAMWGIQPSNWQFIVEIGGFGGLNIPYKELIDPDNWGDTKKADAPFKGLSQPRHLLALYHVAQLRPRIQFKLITEPKAL